jgi:predicted DNA-binding protein (MmcQ/YjbR family)
MLSDLIEDSYDLVVSQLPTSRREALGWHGKPPDA